MNEQQAVPMGSHTKVIRPQVSNKKGYQLDLDSSDEGPNIEVPQVDVYMGHSGKDLRRQEQSYNDNFINASQQTDSRIDTMHQNVDVDLGDDTLLDGQPLQTEGLEQSQHAQQYNLDCSMITTESDINRWKAFS